MATDSKYTNKLFNEHTITPRNLTQYNAFRGITDFTQIGQFDQYETGYQFLEVIGIPKFIEKFAGQNDSFKQIVKDFVHMLEFEFRGLEGLEDISTDTMTITDGINEQRMINRVSWNTAINISMPYFEKRGSLITKFSEFYLTGIKDPKTQAKTYHGLIASNDCPPGFDNEVFTLMYYVTDNTMLRLERAVLLCNCQLTKAELSMYNGSRDSINNREMQIEFTAFPVVGYEVDKAANYLLKNITGYINNPSEGSYNGKFYGKERTVLDSMNYRYGIMMNSGDANYPNPAGAIVNDRLYEAANQSVDRMKDDKCISDSLNPDEWHTGGYNGRGYNNPNNTTFDNKKPPAFGSSNAY